jgi:hypothetical protein
VPVILATQEVEIRRIVVRSQPKANSLQDPISRKPITKKGWREALSSNTSDIKEKKLNKIKKLNLNKIQK